MTGVLTALVLSSAGPVVVGTAAAASTPRCRGEVATIVGTPGKDDLRGTAGRDVIVGLAGNDRIDAGAGDDLVCGGDGRDRIRGGTGDDRLYGQLHGVLVVPGGGRLSGDLLEGGPGDDRLVPGADRRFKDHAGFERITFAHSDMPVAVDLSARSRWGTATGDGEDRIRLGGRLKVIGSAHDDTMTGSDGDDHLLGGPGADRLSGLAGRDTLEGGSFTPAPGDDDVLDGGAGPDAIVTFGGRDVIHGGPGGDFVGTYGTLPVQVYGDEGNDDLLGAAVGQSGYLVDGGPGRDHAQLGSPVEETASQAGSAGFDQATGVWQVSFLAGRVSSAAVSSTGTAVGVEEVDLGWEFAWTYSGTNGPDVVTGSYYFPLHATMLGGDDTVSGSRWRRSAPAADSIDGGDGHDVGYLVTVEDTAVGLEETHPDELVIP